jgi:Zn finger protein HypA/HybF involved in hydrogenase expression
MTKFETDENVRERALNRTVSGDSVKNETDFKFKTHITDLSTSRYCPCCGESYPFPKVLCPNCYSWECRACGYKRMAHIANLLCPKCSSPDFEVSIEKKHVVDFIEKSRREHENDLKKQSGLLRGRNRMC